MATETNVKLTEPAAVLILVLPGPDRKRSQRPYCYRLTHQNPDPGSVGCALLWEVTGGRMPYQIALERLEDGSLRLHCTCADAVYRAEDQGRFCKHVEGLIEVSRLTGACAAAEPAPPIQQLRRGA
jgi:hypothetical protein